MKNTIKLRAEKDKVYINLNTLRSYTCTLFIHPDSKKDWVQINRADVKKFIAEQKAQIEDSVIVTE